MMRMAVVIKNGDSREDGSNKSDKKLQRRHTWSCKKAWMGLNNAIINRRLSGLKRQSSRSESDNWDGK